MVLMVISFLRIALEGLRVIMVVVEIRMERVLRMVVTIIRLMVKLMAREMEIMM
jgi:hypothetical protein